jgi:hypothetical protein
VSHGLPIRPIPKTPLDISMAMEKRAATDYVDNLPMRPIRAFQILQDQPVSDKPGAACMEQMVIPMKSIERMEDSGPQNRN